MDEYILRKYMLTQFKVNNIVKNKLKYCSIAHAIISNSTFIFKKLRNISFFDNNWLTFVSEDSENLCFDCIKLYGTNILILLFDITTTMYLNALAVLLKCIVYINFKAFGVKLTSSYQWRGIETQ